jgi:HEAT repeats
MPSTPGTPSTQQGSAGSELPRPAEPPDPGALPASPRDRLEVLERRVGARDAALWCAELLGGADPRTRESLVVYLAGASREQVVERGFKPYWFRVWGGRGLLYVWDDEAVHAVLRGLRDTHWRVAEMCLKVAAKRDVAEAATAAVDLTHHELPRVRANAVRVLGVTGDTEHVAAVRAAADDESGDVRRAAETALSRMVQRLDLPG